MGNVAACCCHRNRTSPVPQDNKVIRLLVVGLDNAGKTTAAKGFVGEPVSSPAPTLGFCRLEGRRRGWPLHVYDVGGGRTIRAIWRNYLAECHGLVYVVDAGDPRRVDECRGALHALLQDRRVAGKPVLLLANKQDVETALDEVELNERLQLEAAANQNRCPMRIELCAAAAGGATVAGRPGRAAVDAGFHWLADYVIDNFGALSARVAADMAERAAEVERQVRARQERVRRGREAAAAAAAAADAAASRKQDRHRLEATSSPSTSSDTADGDGGHPPHRDAPAAAGAALSPCQQPGPALSTPPDAGDAPRAGSLINVKSEADEEENRDADTLERQIDEVFTRTEMGRLVHEQHPASDSSEERTGSRESWLRAGVEDGLGKITSSRQTLEFERSMMSVSPGQEEKGDRTPVGRRNGTLPALRTSRPRSRLEERLDARSEDSLPTGKRKDTKSITPTPSPEEGSGEGRPGVPAAQSDGDLVSHGGGASIALKQAEKDSGQGSTKESDSEPLASSGGSQMSNGLRDPGAEPGARSRNRFFKRYTKTAPVPADDVLMTSISSQRPPSQ